MCAKPSSTARAAICSAVTTRGAKVLHPRCLEPAREADIPIHIRCTKDPDAEGTVISASGGASDAEAIAIATRGSMTIVDMGVESSWQQVGVLADITRCFARHGYSIDSIASSQTRITVALDPSANPAHDASRDALVAELRNLGHVRLVTPVASVSIIGRHLASVLHNLPSLFESLKREKDVYLLSHAANDRSFTFVVDESGVDAIVHRLHADLRLAREAEDGARASA